MVGVLDKVIRGQGPSAWPELPRANGIAVRGGGNGVGREVWLDYSARWDHVLFRTSRPRTF